MATTCRWRPFPSTSAALDGLLLDGITIMSGGFGLAGNPESLIPEIRSAGVKDLTVISNNAGADEHGRIVGIPPDEAQRIACVADLVAVCVERRDLAFLGTMLGERWTIPIVRIDARWTLAFDWIEGFGATNIRLE